MEQVILNTLLKGMYDMVTKLEVLSKDPQMELAATVLFIEAREEICWCPVWEHSIQQSGQKCTPGVRKNGTRNVPNAQRMDILRSVAVAGAKRMRRKSLQTGTS